MRIGIDLDETISAMPEWFSLLTKAVVTSGHEIHVITYREAGTEPAVFGHPLAQTVEPFGHRLAFGEGQGLGALVDFDAGQDPLVGEQFRKRRAVGSALAQGFVEQDDAIGPTANRFG